MKTPSSILFSSDIEPVRRERSDCLSSDLAKRAEWVQGNVLPSKQEVEKRKKGGGKGIVIKKGCFVFAFVFRALCQFSSVSSSTEGAYLIYVSHSISQIPEDISAEWSRSVIAGVPK